MADSDKVMRFLHLSLQGEVDTWCRVRVYDVETCATVDLTPTALSEREGMNAGIRINTQQVNVRFSCG